MENVDSTLQKGGEKTYKCQVSLKSQEGIGSSVWETEAACRVLVVWTSANFWEFTLNCICLCRSVYRGSIFLVKLQARCLEARVRTVELETWEGKRKSKGIYVAMHHGSTACLGGAQSNHKNKWKGSVDCGFLMCSPQLMPISRVIWQFPLVTSFLWPQVSLSPLSWEIILKLELFKGKEKKGEKGHLIKSIEIRNRT